MLVVSLLLWEPLNSAQSPLADIVPGELVVKLAPHITPTVGQRSLQAAGLRLLKVLPHSQLLKVSLPPGQETDTLTQLAKQPEIQYIDYNHRLQALVEPDDPNYQNGNQWAIDKMELPAAWQVQNRPSDLTIAIIDSGIDLTHEDLISQIITGYNYLNPLQPPVDDFNHGSHVAGIAAATTDNELGIASISWGMQIMPLKILDYAGNGESADLAEAIYYAVDNGANIINMSIGKRGSRWPCDMPSVEEAFQYADQHGVLLFSAAGNDGQEGVNCPAAYDEVMAVGATNRNDSRAYFSNYGPRLDVVAPGYGIYSTIPRGYGYNNGTSMASPQAAGLAGLLWSFAPTLPHHEIRQILETSTDDLGAPGFDDKFGWGRLNARQAMARAINLNIVLPTHTFLMDDDTLPLQSQGVIQANQAEVISWTATISPAVNWVALTSEAAGQVSAASPGNLLLQINRPDRYGRYTTTLTITSHPPIATTETILEIHYLPQLYETYLPLVVR